jgi:hypothetical protein
MEIIRQVPLPTSNDTLNMGFHALPSMDWGTDPPPVSANPITWDTTDPIYIQNISTITILADTLRSRGIHWIVINFPVSYFYKNSNNYSFWGPSWPTAKGILQQMRNLETTNQFFHLYDANKEGNHDYMDEDAFDSDHLSAVGANKLTARLDMLIDSILNK